MLLALTITAKQFSKAFMFSKRKDVIANIASGEGLPACRSRYSTMPVNGQAATVRKNGNPAPSRKGQIQR
jgi:hypothetical protein